VIFVGVLLAGLLLPPLTSVKTEAIRINCVNNLKQTGLAFQIWSGDHGEKYPMSVPATNGGTMELVATGDVFPHFQVVSNELNTPKILVCPGDSERAPATNFISDFTDRQISYFVGLDADEARPHMFLAGDRQITLGGALVRHGLVILGTNTAVGWAERIHRESKHLHTGNVGMADGSVQELSSAKLGKALAKTGAATNRLAIP
jgi:prepilin-type processing-associated H-X9-DG protein